MTPAEPTDVAPSALHVPSRATRGSSHSLGRFAVIGFLLMVGALAWGFLATAIDLSFGSSYLAQHWSDVPKIMRERVPGYTFMPVVAAPVSYAVALSMIYVGGKVRRGERRWTFAHLLFVLGVTWASFGFLTLQLDFATYEINPDGPGNPAGYLTVSAGWAGILTSVVLLLRPRKPAAGKTDRSLPPSTPSSR
jgi:hypothetical protein